MNWIKVEPNPADNDAHPERLPPLDTVVHVIYRNTYDDGQIVALGGRVEGDDGWLWAINDRNSGYLQNDDSEDLIADDEYRVTHWAEIEWPKESKHSLPKRPYCQHCHGKGWFRGLEAPCAWCNPGGEFRAI